MSERPSGLSQPKPTDSPRPIFERLPSFRSSLLAALAVVSSVALTDTPDSSVTGKTPLSAIAQPEKKDIFSVPDFQVIDQDFSPIVPPGLQISSEEFETITLSIGQKVSTEVEQYLKPEFVKNPDNNLAACQVFLERCFQIIRTADTRIARVFPSKPDLLDINRYLLPAGFYLAVSFITEQKMAVDFYPIQKKFQVEVTGQQEVTIPVLEMGEPLMDSGEPGTTGTLDQDALYLITIPSNNRDEAKWEVGEGSKYFTYSFPRFSPLTQDSERAYAENWVQDTLRHESTHGYLLKLFPNIKVTELAKHHYDVPMGFRFDGKDLVERFQYEGKMVEIRGKYTALMFHELAAVGAEMATSDVDMPEFHMHKLFTLKNPKDAYYLQNKFLILATLQAAPDSDIKRELIDKVKTGKNLTREDIARIVGTPPFTLQNTRKTGEIMFQLGVQLLKDGFDGKFTSIPK